MLPGRVGIDTNIKWKKWSVCYLVLLWWLQVLQALLRVNYTLFGILKGSDQREILTNNFSVFDIDKKNACIKIIKTS